MHKVILFMVICMLGLVRVTASEPFVVFKQSGAGFPLISNGKVADILFDENDQKGIGIAVENLTEDFSRVCGQKPRRVTEVTPNCIIVGSLESKYIKSLIKSRRIDKKELQGKKREIYHHHHFPSGEGGGAGPGHCR